MESLEEMKRRLTSLKEQKITAERTSDLSYAEELKTEIAELEAQLASLPNSKAVGDEALKKIREMLNNKNE